MDRFRFSLGETMTIVAVTAATLAVARLLGFPRYVQGVCAGMALLGFLGILIDRTSR